jgi:predicted peptidase
MNHYVIYFPGLGDHKNFQIQTKALEKWHKFGLDPKFHHIGWNDNESYKIKLSKAVRTIDKIPSSHIVSIVACSAGASMAMNVYAERKSRISAAVFICGKINNPDAIMEWRKKQNPSLLDCVTASSKNAKELKPADKQKMLVIQPVFDGVVTKNDGRIPLVKHKTIFAFFHSVAIYLSLTLYKRASINFLKAKAVQ